MNIAGVEIGPDQPCRIVAEISNAHNGSYERAVRLIHESAEAGADFVKFQCYTPDELVLLRGDGPAPDPWGSDGWTMRDLYEKAQTPLGWFPGLERECFYAKVPWFSSVFGGTSIETLRRLACPAFKVAALDVDARLHLWLPLHVPTIASSRGKRIPWADLTLFCPEGYPQDPGDFAGYAMRDLDGISYHGTTPPTWAIPYSQIIECHVQLDDEPSELEANVSLTMSQLRTLCDAASPVRP